MTNVKTEKQILKEVGYNLHSAGMKGWFAVSNYADWCIQVGIKVSDIKDFEEISGRYESEVVILNGSKRAGMYSISSLWTDAYVKGIQPSGCSFIKLPKSQEYDVLRYRISQIQTTIERAGYKVDGIHYRNYFWYKENGKVQTSPALCFSITSKELDEWRDEQYQTHLYESEMEVEDDRRREMTFAEYQFNH